MLTEAILRQMWPRGDAKVPGLVSGIAASAPSVFRKYGIDSDLVIAHMMAQFSHECGAGLEMTENINYTAERAAQVWPTRFSSAADCYKKVGSWAGDPDFSGKLIDSVYGSRMGNRPGTHDGRTYIGRGLAQTTGRNGYTELQAKTGLPVLDNPDIVNRPGNALECGVADFILCGCLPYAKQDDVLEVTKHLNGGTIGLSDRRAWLVRWKTVLEGSPSIPTSVPGPIPVSLPAPTPIIHPKHAVGLAGFVLALTAAIGLAPDNVPAIAMTITGGIVFAVLVHFLWKGKKP